MKISLFTIHVSDMAKSIGFYKKVFGMEIARELRPNENLHLVFLKNEGEITVELVDDGAHSEREGCRSNVAMGVFVENMEKVVGLLKENKVSIKNGPFETPNGTKLLFVEDPDGVVIEFVQEKA
jgi:lactoylglutathione lyase